MEQEEQEEILDRRQKIVVALLAFLGISSLVLGFFQFKGTIRSPFQPRVSSVASSRVQSSEGESLQSLKEKDTDEDGLNDYDEFYVYNTSPYVRDSDSDGFSDQEEIQSGNNPNCPKGKECLAESLAEAPPQVTNTNAEIQSAEVSSQDLRTTLKKLGVPATLLDSMDDQTIREVYEETVKKTGTPTGSATNRVPPGFEGLAPQTTQSQELTVETLKSLDASQVRDLLKKSGIEESALNKIDDQTLEAIYQETLNQELQGLSSSP